MQSYDLQINQGESYSLNLSVLDDNQVPIDLTGMSGRAYLRRFYGDTGFYDLNPIFTDAASGQLTFSLAKEVTASLPVTVGVYDLTLFNPTGSALKPLKGNAYVYPQVSF